MAAIALAATPAAIAAQTSSARPAAVALTVVVPSRLTPGASLASDEGATVLHRDATTMDLETLVALADWPASRIEVRLARGWLTDSAHVSVRNQNGRFETLDDGARVIALDMPASLGRARTALQFRVASSKPLAAGIAIPVEYRVTVGTADQVAIFTYPAVIRPGTSQ